jgi:hypothetical protein
MMNGDRDADHRRIAWHIRMIRISRMQAWSIAPAPAHDLVGDASDLGDGGLGLPRRKRLPRLADGDVGGAAELPNPDRRPAVEMPVHETRMLVRDMYRHRLEGSAAPQRQPRSAGLAAQHLIAVTESALGVDQDRLAANEQLLRPLERFPTAPGDHRHLAGAGQQRTEDRQRESLHLGHPVKPSEDEREQKRITDPGMVGNQDPTSGDDLLAPRHPHMTDAGDLVKPQDRFEDRPQAGLRIVAFGGGAGPCQDGGRDGGCQVRLGHRRASGRVLWIVARRQSSIESP